MTSPLFQNLPIANIFVPRSTVKKFFKVEKTCILRIVEVLLLVVGVQNEHPVLLRSKQSLNATETFKSFILQHS